MKRKYAFSIALAAAMLTLLAIVGSGTTGAARQSNQAASVFAVSMEQLREEQRTLSPLLAEPNVNNTHLVMSGTAWVPQRRAQLAISPMGWGTVLRKKKVAGSEWVHIPLPTATYLKGVSQKISAVEFCAKITSANSRPMQMDLWDVDNRFYSGAITGWPVNTIHCHSVGFNPPVWRSALSLSVNLQFANLTDQITLYKAWVNLSE